MLAAVAVLCVALAGSTASAESPSPAAGQSTLRVGWLQDPDNLNPFLGMNSTCYEVWHLNYDYLVGFDTESLSPRPEIAESWTASDDGKTWTFKIRDDITWQDGEPLTADDVAFTFNYIIDNQTQNGTIYVDGITHVEAPDATTAVFHCDAPKANILAMIVQILPEHVWSKLSVKEATASFTNPAPIIGSGPFQVVEVKKGSYIRMEANDAYWKGRPHIDELIFMTYTNADTMAQDLSSGALDAAYGLSAPQFTKLSTEDGLTARKGTLWRFTELGMNCYDSPDSKGNPVLLDQRVREAINWAIDREKVVELAWNGMADVGSSIIVPVSKFHWEPSDAERIGFDPDKARTILEEAGYKDSDGDGYRETLDGEELSLRFYATTDSPENVIAAKLITGWLTDIQLKVKLSVVDAGVLLDAQYSYTGDTYTPDWDLFIWYWTQDVDPNFQVGIYTPQQIEGWNDCLWTDPEYTRLNDLQITELDETKRTEIVLEQQRMFYEACPYVVLTYPAQLEVYNTGDWEGWTPAPADVGSVVFNYNNIDTYLNVRPIATGETTSDSSTYLVMIAVVAAVAVIVGTVVVLMRRRGKATEE